MLDESPLARPTAFLDEKPGGLFPRLRWLTPRRLALFLVFWISVFFAGSVFINNPFAGSAGAANWDLGAGSPNYYWVVMYLHGLNTGLVGLAALVACDFFDLPSRHVRRGILAGVLLAGALAPIGAVFNTTAPWTSAGLWVQVAAFLALDEILVLFLWGMLEVWRSGAPRSRTLPFLTTALTGVTFLVAALIGHLAGTILGFGDNPPLLGQYANQELGVSLNDWATSLIGAHAYLMITAVPAGVISLVAARFGYFRLTGTWKRIAQAGLIFVGLDLLFQTGMALLAGFSTWPGDLPPEVTSISGVPSFLALNDAIDFVFLVLGGVFVLLPLLVQGARSRGWHLPASLPLRALPLVMLVMFAALTTVTEPSDGSAVGTPPQAWLRLFIGFYLTMLVVLVVLLAERVLGERHQLRVGWTATVGSLLVFGGVLTYSLDGSAAGGIVALVGLLGVGLSWVGTSYWGLGAPSLAPPRPALRVASGGSAATRRSALRGSGTLVAGLGAVAAAALLLVAAAAAVAPPPSAPPSMGANPVPAVEYVNSSVEPSPGGGHEMFSPGNFTVASNTTVVFTFTIYDTNRSESILSATVVQGTVNGTEELIPYPGAAPENLSTLPMGNMSHSFTIVLNTTIVNIPLAAATAPGEPATVVATVVFGQSGTFTWYCDPFCEPYRIQPGDGMAGTITVT